MATGNHASNARMRLIGVDENGYGPQLGPLVVTASAADAPTPPGPDDENRWRAHDLWRRLPFLADGPGGKSPVRDSKELFPGGSRVPAKVEDLILAYFYLQAGFVPETTACFLEHATVNRQLGLPFPCAETGRRSLCRGASLPIDLPDGRRRRVADLASRLDAAARASGVAWLETRSLVLCPALFNAAVDGRRFPNGPWLTSANNKAALTARAGLALVARLAGPDRNFCAVLGKVGGTRYYRDYLAGSFPGAAATLAERAELSAYRVRSGRSAGTVFYLRGAEAGSFPVCLASLFGKYVRELFLAQAHTVLCREVPGLAPASGYHDGNTRRFIEQTAAARKRLGIDDKCFFRR